MSEEIKYTKEELELANHYMDTGHEQLNEVEMFDVWAKKNGEMQKFNKKPLSKKEADKMANDLKRATIPSVDQKSIEVKGSK